MADREESQPIHNPNEWEELYHAVLETDQSKMQQRIDAVESAIQARMQEFSLNHGGTPEENQAMVDALNALSVLRKEVAAWQGLKRAG